MSKAALSDYHWTKICNIYKCMSSNNIHKIRVKYVKINL